MIKLVEKDYALLCDSCYRLIDANQPFFEMKFKRADLYVCSSCAKEINQHLTPFVEKMTKN